MLRLNLGCGARMFDGWDNIDLYHPGCLRVDIECLEDVYKPDTVDEIFASDVLEHISHRRVDAVFASWCRLLKKRGTLYVRVPDARKQAELLASTYWDVRVYRHMVYGGQDTEGNFHYTAFDMCLLRQLMEANGLDVIHFDSLHHGITKDVGTSSNPNIEMRGKKK